MKIRLGLAALVLALAASSAHGETPAAYCARVINDDQTRSIPRSLVPFARARFGLGESYSDAELVDLVTWRCMDGRVLGCYAGANLPCYKADTSRHLPGAEKFCAGNPNSEMIPMAATGHGSVYDWRCKGRRAIPVGVPHVLDRRGFFPSYWGEL